MGGTRRRTRTTATAAWFPWVSRNAAEMKASVATQSPSEETAWPIRSLRYPGALMAARNPPPKVSSGLWVNPVSRPRSHGALRYPAGMVAVVADSAANLPGELARELRIEVVPMYLNLGDAVYRDGTELSPTDFYRRLVEDGEPATTSVPSPGDYLDAYRRAGQDEVVCVTVASSMS